MRGLGLPIGLVDTNASFRVPSLGDNRIDGFASRYRAAQGREIVCTYVFVQHAEQFSTRRAVDVDTVFRQEPRTIRTHERPVVN